MRLPCQRLLKCEAWEASPVSPCSPSPRRALCGLREVSPQAPESGHSRAIPYRPRTSRVLGHERTLMPSLVLPARSASLLPEITGETM